MLSFMLRFKFIIHCFSWERTSSSIASSCHAFLRLNGASIHKITTATPEITISKEQLPRIHITYHLDGLTDVKIIFFRALHSTRRPIIVMETSLKIKFSPFPIFTVWKLYKYTFSAVENVHAPPLRQQLWYLTFFLYCGIRSRWRSEFDILAIFFEWL